jgi:hypothetical protein
LFQWRNFVCGAMIVALPASLVADDTGAAMLHNQGGVLLNGKPAADSSAIFRNDTIQTQPHYEATIDTTGSTVTVKEETLIQHGENELFLEHGTLLVSTSRGMAVRVGCLRVVPVTAEWTQYDVTDVNGKVTVNAQKNDVQIEVRRTGSQEARQQQPSDRATVREGEHATREEKCSAAAKRPRYEAANGAILNDPWAKWSAVGVIGVVTCVALCRGDDPVSPSHP